MNLQSKATQTVEERNSVYGPMTESAENTGKIWAGMLSMYFEQDLEPLPPWLVHLMVGGLKLGRACRPYGYHADNYVDAQAYLHAANEEAAGRDIVKAVAGKTTELQATQDNPNTMKSVCPQCNAVNEAAIVVAVINCEACRFQYFHRDHPFKGQGE